MISKLVKESPAVSELGILFNDTLCSTLQLAASLQHLVIFHGPEEDEQEEVEELIASLKEQYPHICVQRHDFIQSSSQEVDCAACSKVILSTELSRAEYCYDYRKLQGYGERRHHDFFY